jgi:hypothetical protein
MVVHVTEPTSRPADPKLAQAVRDELKNLRRQGLIPTELRFAQDAWNALSPEMRFAPFGGKRALLFEGLPCVLAVGLKTRFAVQTIAPRD